MDWLTQQHQHQQQQQQYKAMTISTDNKTVYNDIRLGVIGGTGLYQLEGYEKVDEVQPETPWGQSASPIKILRTPRGHHIAFLARHGLNHEFSPSEVPYTANIAALKSIGVQAIVAFSAVGSLQEIIKPGDFVLPNQIIDRTKGIRKDSFFGNGVIAHASFGEPFHKPLKELIYSHRDSVPEITIHKDKVAVSMEGPAFSTRAESNLYRSWGGDIINMTCIPEAKLAREAEIAYQLVCMSTDYDAWRESEEPVTVAEVMKTMTTNAVRAKALLFSILPDLEDKLYTGDKDSIELVKDIRGTMALAFQQPKDGRAKEKCQTLAYIFPGYFTL
ncbi:S-methyl-5-thioadenosine phosphorylase [Mycoemilia scoparia]|uniref:S-methyl-5'-thioadenosine phosphorylase n=1 Tax=Mycoemilia scoparia TaxID=417184 RepID=A0A9W8DW90_9FUNG|nr:S-methyl-5-thioadenosine phosphorylase [Mycoemilia scoparia]